MDSDLIRLEPEEIFPAIFADNPKHLQHDTGLPDTNTAVVSVMSSTPPSLAAKSLGNDLEEHGKQTAQRASWQ